MGTDLHRALGDGDEHEKHVFGVNEAREFLRRNGFPQIRADAMTSAMVATLYSISQHVETTAEEINRLKIQLALRDDQIKKLEELSDTDLLTGIRNRRHFERQFAEKLSRRSPSTADDRRTHHAYPDDMMIVFDLDNFKRINTEFTLVGGDMALVEVTKAVKSKLKRHDTFARWGGDEFAIILDGASEDNAQKKLAAIEAAVKGLEVQCIDNKGVMRTMPLSITGRVRAIRQNDDPETVIREVSDQIRMDKDAKKKDIAGKVAGDGTGASFVQYEDQRRLPPANDNGALGDFNINDL